MAGMREPVRAGAWIFNVLEHSTAISPDRATVYSFDLEGRPLSWFEGGRVYKRSLASELYGRQRAGGARRHFWVPLDKARGLFATVLRRVSEAPVAGLEAAVRDRLDDILRWTPEALLRERERFDAAYRPITILPPDQYLAIMLQATFGCSWNRCTFCNFYQDRPFRTRSVEAFRSHVLAVRSLLGRGEKLRRRLFLADGNALVLSNDRLRPILDAARSAFPGRPVHGFVDIFVGERKRAEEWAELRELGLRGVCLGIETGHDPLLRWMNKPGSANEAVELVVALKRAGLRVSAILMCGAGGDRFAGAHVADTLALVSRLPLGEGDIVYLSPFVEHPESRYARRAMEDRVRPLDLAEHERQYARLRDGIRRLLPGVKVARYDLREFVY
jgi:radical SAM superfamily enzyme YgiQ (UPF0313 family)